MTSAEFRCLAVRQPWAWALVASAKDVENRTWTTPYRGPIIIQASSTKAVVNQLAKAGRASLPPMAFNYGALIGIVDLIDIEPLSESFETNPWAWGPYCWRVANARAFDRPISIKGKLNLYALPELMTSEVQLAIDGATPVSRSEAFSAWVDCILQEDAEVRRVGLFNNYLALNDGANLLRLAEVAIATSNDSHAYADRAVAKSILEDDIGALSDADNSIRLDPDNARAYRVRGLIHDFMGQAELAETDRRRATELGEPPSASNADPDEGSET